MALQRTRHTEEKTTSSGRYKEDDADYEERDTERDYEDRPRRRRPAAQEEEARPARRSRREEPEEEERPARRSRTSRAAEEEDERPARRRSREDRDEDERPVAAKRPSLKSGWGAAEKAQAAQGDWAKTAKLTSEEVVFKFLDDEPFVVFGQHWIEKAGKKSYVCLNDPSSTGKSECPLCDIGDKPRIFSAFNLLRLEPDNDPVLEVLQAASRLTTALKDKNAGKDGPLTKMYWALSTSGKGTNTTYNLVPVKERDLEEDWDYIPLDDDEIDDFGKDAYTKETFPDGVSSKRDLQEIVEEIG